MTRSQCSSQLWSTVTGVQAQWLHLKLIVLICSCLVYRMFLCLVVVGQCGHQGSVILALSSLSVGINNYLFYKRRLLARESFGKLWCGAVEGAELVASYASWVSWMLIVRTLYPYLRNLFVHF